jgi:hypothetical protein
MSWKTRTQNTLQGANISEGKIQYKFTSQGVLKIIFFSRPFIFQSHSVNRHSGCSVNM